MNPRIVAVRMRIYRAIARNYSDSIVNEVAHGHDSTIGGKGRQGLARRQNSVIRSMISNMLFFRHLLEWEVWPC